MDRIALLELKVRLSCGRIFRRGCYAHGRDDSTGSNAVRSIAWWIKLGIAHQRIEPGQPQQNGRHERMHKTLKRETARPPERDHKAQQARFDVFRTEFNWERPHEALGQNTPASLYVASARPLPKALPAPAYPGHFQVRLVSKSSMFRLHHRPIFLSEALINEYIGLEETGDGVWSLYFYDVLLGRLDERDYKVRG